MQQPYRLWGSICVTAAGGMSCGVLKVSSILDEPKYVDGNEQRACRLHRPVA